jgi:hypothetical protein
MRRLCNAGNFATTLVPPNKKQSLLLSSSCHKHDGLPLQVARSEWLCDGVVTMAIVGDVTKEDCLQVYTLLDLLLSKNTASPLQACAVSFDYSSTSVE